MISKKRDAADPGVCEWRTVIYHGGARIALDEIEKEATHIPLNEEVIRAVCDRDVRAGLKTQEQAEALARRLTRLADAPCGLLVYRYRDGKFRVHHCIVSDENNPGLHTTSVLLARSMTEDQMRDMVGAFEKGAKALGLEVYTGAQNEGYPPLPPDVRAHASRLGGFPAPG